MPNRIAFFTVTLLVSWSARAEVEVFPRWHWSLNGRLTSTCSAPASVSCTSPRLVSKTGNSDSYDPFGRWRSALRLRPESSGGYLTESLEYLQGEEPFDNRYGAAWMAFVWVDDLPQATSSILWWEGDGSASFALLLDSQGYVSLVYGQQRAWRGRINSMHRVGRKSWHHVAFVHEPVGNGIVRLLVNGIEQGSAVLPLPGGPDQSRTAPLAIGTNKYNPFHDLDGKVDEVKFIQFSPSSDYLQAVRNEHHLHFRNRIIDDLIAAGRLSPDQIDSLREPTFESTSLLRAHVAHFYVAGNACQPSPNCPRPLDPLNIPPGSSRAAYVYPLYGEAVTYGSESGQLNGRYNSLYLNLSEPCTGIGPGCNELGRPRVTGYCGSSAMTLWAAYKAFGFAARRYDFIDGTEFSYSRSHVTTSVYVTDTGAGDQFLMQDPTYNVSGYNGSDSYAVEQFPYLRLARPTLDDGGFNFFGSGPERHISRWNDSYWDYFNSVVSLSAAWDD